MIFLIKKKEENYFRRLLIITLFIIFLNARNAFLCGINTQPRSDCELKINPIGFNEVSLLNSFKSRNTGLSIDSNETLKVSKLLNVTISLEEPFNLYTNNEIYSSLDELPSNYSVEIDSINYSSTLETIFSATWIFNTQDYTNGSHELRIFVKYISGDWLIFNLTLLIDNAPPLMSLSFPWNDLQPNEPSELYVNFTDLLLLKRVQITVDQLTTHDMIVNKTFNYPMNYSLIIIIPGLPIGFHGYIKVYVEDEVGNYANSGSKHFKVRSINVNKAEILYENSDFRENTKPQEGLIALFRGSYYYLNFSIENYLIDQETEKYQINASINSELIRSRRVVFQEGFFSYEYNFPLRSDGLCGNTTLSVKWSQISSNDTEMILGESFYIEFNVFIYSQPISIIPDFALLNMLFLFLIGFLYLIGNRNFGEKRIKHSFVFPHHSKALIAIIVFSVIILISFSTIIVDLFSEEFFIPIFLFFFHPGSVTFLFLSLFFVSILFISSYKISRNTVLQSLKTTKFKKIVYPFDFWFYGIVFFVQIITFLVNSSIYIEFFQGIFFSDIRSNYNELIQIQIPFNILHFIPFLSVVLFQLFFLQNVHRFFSHKKLKEEIILYADFITFFFVVILFSNIFFWYFPLIDFLFLFLSIGLFFGLFLELFVKLLLSKKILITPDDWVQPSLLHIPSRPGYMKGEMKYVVIHPRWVSVSVKNHKGKKIDLIEESRLKKIIKIEEPIEYGIYRFQFIFSLFWITLFSEFRSFLIKPLIDTEIIRDYMSNLEMEVDYVNSFDIGTPNLRGRQVFHITSVLDPAYSSFQGGIIYLINQSPSVDIMRDCFDAMCTSWVKNKKKALIILPSQMDVYTALQRNLYQSKDDVLIIPIIYSEIVEFSKFEGKKEDWKRMTDIQIRRYSIIENLFTITKPVDSPGEFFGREGILTEIMGNCEIGQPFAIIGLYRIGKTSIAKALARRLIKKMYILVYPISQDNLYELLKELWENLRDEISIRLDNPEINEINYDDKNTRGSFRKLMNVLRKESLNEKLHDTDNLSKCVLILDEVTALMKSKMPEADKMKFLRFIKSITEEFDNLLVGLILHDEGVTKEPRYPTFQLFTEYWISGLDYISAEQLILDSADQMQIEFPIDLAKKIVQYWDGHPLLIRNFCNLLYNKYQKKIPSISDDDFKELTLDDDFISKDEETHSKVWMFQLSDQEKELLCVLAQEKEFNDLDFNREKILRKIKLKGLVSSTGKIKSFAFKEWIKINIKL